MTATHDPRWADLNVRYCDAVNYGRTHEARQLARQIAAVEAECAASAPSAPYATVAQSPTVLAIVSGAEHHARMSGSPSGLCCAADAYVSLVNGRDLAAVRWALRSMSHSAGVLHPAFRRMVEDAVALFPLEHLDTYGVLGGAR